MSDTVVPVLPESVRRHLGELAAAVLGELTPQESPVALRRVREFAPARRARAGSGPLAVALERDAVFRHRVAAAWRGVHPDLAQALDDGEVPAAADPAAALAGVYLLRPSGWEDLAAGLRGALAECEQARLSQDAGAEARAEVLAARADVDRLESALRAERAALEQVQEEVTALRRELRRARSDADRARAAQRQAQQQADADRLSVAGLQESARAAARSAQDRVRDAQERADQARRAARDGRSLDDARVRLLLDTVVEAATGLRRELALPPVELRPADLIMDDVVAGSATALADRQRVAAKGQPPDDPGLLADLLALPQSHLVVDGYNVTKAGYGALPLVEQRRRLVDGLAMLAARTASEVTCCFDGADVEAPGATRVRGVRVLFSKPGVTADELIRRLVRAEPSGRPVVVVSSDAEVVSGVLAAGARAVPASALLRLLARG